jgi:hypothetical protein
VRTLAERRDRIRLGPRDEHDRTVAPVGDERVDEQLQAERDEER